MNPVIEHIVKCCFPVPTPENKEFVVKAFEGTSARSGKEFITYIVRQIFEDQPYNWNFTEAQAYQVWSTLPNDLKQVLEKMHDGS